LGRMDAPSAILANFFFREIIWRKSAILKRKSNRSLVPYRRRSSRNQSSTCRRLSWIKILEYSLLAGSPKKILKNWQQRMLLLTGVVLFLPLLQFLPNCFCCCICFAAWGQPICGRGIFCFFQRYAKAASMAESSRGTQDKFVNINNLSS